jgi:hypothetical protein
LHDDRPDVNASIQNDYREQTKLSTTTLTKRLEVEDETKQETSDTGIVSAFVHRGSDTYMQKNGEIRDERARLLVLKYVAR